MSLFGNNPSRSGVAEGFYDRGGSYVTRAMMVNLGRNGLIAVSDLDNYDYEPASATVGAVAEVINAIRDHESAVAAPVTAPDDMLEYFLGREGVTDPTNVASAIQRIKRGDDISDVVNDYAPMGIEYAVEGVQYSTWDEALDAMRRTAVTKIEVVFRKGTIKKVADIDLGGVGIPAAMPMMPVVPAMSAIPSVSMVDRLFAQLPVGSWRIAGFDKDGNPTRLVLFYEKKAGKLLVKTVEQAKRMIAEDEADSSELGWYAVARWEPADKEGKRFKPVPDPASRKNF